MNTASTREPLLSTYVQAYMDTAPASWSFFLDQVRAADRAGFDRIVVPDHVVFGERLAEYARPEVGGRTGGVQPTGPDGSYLEPLTALAVAAGITEQVRLGTAILIAALRRPVTLAKTVATLDVLSGGRVDLGVGVGWQREEYEAVGLDFADRGRLLDHTLEVMQTLWREPVANHRSPELEFSDIHMMPKPQQAGGVPIWVSGTANRRVARRLARFGAGWIPWGVDDEDIEKGIASMSTLLEAEGREIDGLRIVGQLRWQRDEHGERSVERTMAAVPRLHSLGVTDFDLRFRFSNDLEQDTEELTAVVNGFRDVTT